ncbi:hypothetical protein diail_9085 [Diaporthe ilicicola]|nr:hypothetical protein diail_9085 [Diaporthe ilicicola]
MIPGSVRRVAAAAPHSPILSSFGSAVSRAAVANVNLICGPLQQRRYSSSKPSRDNDSGDLPVDQSVQATTASKTAEAKSSVDKRKRKAKEVPETRNLPRVPSTDTIPNEALALSSFFSLHRPISVSHSLPRIITDDAFAAIFKQRSKTPKPSEVVSTISRTVRSLGQPVPELFIQSEPSAAQEAQSGVHRIDRTQADGSEAAVSVQINSMSGNFLPFRPPPLPQPHSATSASAAAEKARADEAVAAEEEQQPQTRVYKAVFTIEESTDANGEVSIMAHSPEFLEQPQSAADAGPAEGPVETRSFLSRMALRQMRCEESRDQQELARNSSMLAISVKRQRKLKMKKKKYKKLQKRLRHERRKHDR